MGVGVMRHRLIFDAPLETEDGYGGTEYGWTERFSSHAELRYAKGDESVEAHRRAGRHAYKVKIRQSANAREITTEWRFRDARRGDAYDITEVDSVSDRQWIFIVATTGGEVQ